MTNAIWPNQQIQLQCCESSPAKHGGAYFSAVVLSKILAITEKAIGRPHAPPILVKFHLARTFGATGKEQPSPPLHLAAAARLLKQFLGEIDQIGQIGFVYSQPSGFLSVELLIFPSMLQIQCSSLCGTC